MKYQQSICRRKSQTKKETQCDANILSKCLAYSIIQLYFGNYARCKLTPQRTYRLWVQLTCLENHAGPGCIPRASTHPSRQPSKQKPDVPQCGPFTGSFLRREGCVKMSSDAMLYFCIPAQLSVFFSLSFWHKQFVGAFGIRPISSHSILLALFSFCFNAEFQQVTRCDLFAFAFLNLGRVLLFPFSFPFSFVSFPPFVGEMNGLQRVFYFLFFSTNRSS